jgi:hypothetical protein
MSNGFQTVDLAHLAFPNEMLVDYVRVYQRPGVGYLGCDPADRPTAAYIANHQDAYQNPNYTTWAAAGYTWPVSPLSTQYDAMLTMPEKLAYWLLMSVFYPSFFFSVCKDTSFMCSLT